MNESEEIPGQESVLRRIPPGTHWQAPGPRITSENFKPREHLGERDISVSRRCVTSPARLLELIPDAAGWRVGEALVRLIRELGSVVIPVPTADDPGHALIKSGIRRLTEQNDRRALARLFRFVSTEENR